MTDAAPRAERAPANSVEVRARLVEALQLDLVGPGAGHALAAERLRSWERPSNWYLTGFLIPSGTPPERRADADEDEDLDEVPEAAGLVEESNEERKTAKKGFFPSSMGLSFLAPGACRALTVTVRWGDYTLVEIAGRDEATTTVWQRTPREAAISIPLGGAAGPVVTDDEAVFVTSANLTEAALDRNIEIGLLVRDRALARTVTSHFSGLIDRKLLRPLPA